MEEQNEKPVKLIKPACPYCGQTGPVVKSGFNNKGGNQRYECQRCRKYFTVEPWPKGYDSHLREQALRMYLEGMSLRGIGRVLGVHHQSLANWVKAAADALPERVADNTPTQTVEIDELFTFVGKKEARLRSSCYSSRYEVSSGVVTMQVLEQREWEDMQHVVDTLPLADNYCSDQCSIYPDLDWPQGSTHIISKGKEQTHTIESLNANLRHYLKRLARKTRCFSKCLKALTRSVRLFAWYYNRRQRVIIARQLSRSINVPASPCILRHSPTYLLICYDYRVGLHGKEVF